MPSFLSAFLLLLSLSLASPAIAQSRRGGLSGSGGGSGVACFPTIEMALKADQFLNQGKVLPEELLSQAKLQVLEAWEIEKLNHEIWQAEPGETWQQHLTKIKNKVQDHFPLFSYRLKQTDDLMKFEDWQPVEEFKLLEDVTLNSPLEENCRRIQIIIRESEGNNPIGEGPVARRPKIKIRYVQSYFKRLSVTDKAMLFFHEQLYILGQSIGQDRSDLIRGFVRIFFSIEGKYEATDEQVLRRTPGETRIKYHLIKYLGDYLLYFIESHPIEKGQPYTAQHHFSAYLNFLKKTRRAVGNCRRNAEAQGHSPDHCMKTVMDGVWDSEDFTKEEAFLFIAAHGLERTQGYNSDHLMDLSPLRPLLFEKAMHKFCELTSEKMNTKAKAVRDAIDYCKEWNLARNPGK